MVKIVFRGKYVHVILPDQFDLTQNSIRSIWPAIADACSNNNCNRILSEGRIRSRNLRPYDAFDSGSKLTEIRGLRHAILLYDYQPDELSDFFRTVASNRGVFVEFFGDKDAALKWLGVDPE